MRYRVRLLLLLMLLLAAAPALADSSATSFTLDPTATLDDAIGDGEPLPDIEAAPPAFGTTGSRRWFLRLGGGVEIDDADNSYYMGSIGYRHFVADGLSLDAEIGPLGAVQDGDNAIGARLDFTLSWHFVCNEDWSLSLDAGIGLLGSSDHIPDDGSSFNFTPQAGIGYTRKLDADRRFQAGVRWYHISNANTLEDNPGLDAIVGYVGISFGF